MARYDDRNWDRNWDRYPDNLRRRGRHADADDGIDRPPSRGDYYDPDHEYRSRRLQGGTDRPYAQRPMPGQYSDRSHRDEEQSWSDPGSWYGEGRYRGVGPKGYVRSDERIRELVCEELMDDPWVDASGIEVVVKDGEVTLSGTVNDRDAKRWAEEAAGHVGGTKHVQNNLRVGS